MVVLFLIFRFCFFMVLSRDWCSVFLLKVSRLLLKLFNCGIRLLLVILSDFRWLCNFMDVFCLILLLFCVI